MTDQEPTPALADFRRRYEADDNEWWRLGSGDHMNLFDDALDEIDRLSARPDAAELKRHLAYLLGQYERVIAMVRHIRMDTPEDQELSERVVAAMEEGAAPVRRVLDGERSDLVARPDAATLREQIEHALSATYLPDHVAATDAVMTALIDYGLVEREARDD